MAQVVVRDLEDDVKKRLKRRAQRHGRSMEEEARHIFPDARVAVFSSDTVMDAEAARTLVASMAAVTTWRLARSTHPEAEQARKMLVRLSGRQMKHGREFTLPALFAGMWTLLVMLE